METQNRFVGKHAYPTVNGRKVPIALESPITEAVYLKTCDKTIDQFHACELNPNAITNIGMILVILSIYCVCIDRPILAGVLYLISYYFDCADGAKSRKFSETSDFGDKFDHFRDWLGFFGLFIVIMMKYPMNKWWLLALGVTIVGTLVHMGCVETFNTYCRGISEPSNMLRVCTYISQYFEPDAYNFARNPKDEDLAAEYCSRMIHQMKMTRWMTDVNTVLLLSFYLIYVGLTKK